MHPRSSTLPILGTLLFACLVLASCGGHGQSPTEPQAATPATMAASAGSSASSSHGDSGGHGHGHGDNGGGSSSFDLAIDPHTWNTEWSHSSGTVAAFVRGAGTADIDLGSLKLSGPAGSPLAPKSSRHRGHQIIARFAKSDAIKLIGSAKPGDSVTITLSFTAKGAAQKLTEKIRVVGPDDDSGD